MGAGDQTSAEGGGHADESSADAGSDEDGGDTDVSQAAPSTAGEQDTEMRDSRSARPEPFEHTFGAQAHPAEQAASDPTHAHAAPASSAQTDAPASAPVSSETPSTES